MKRGFILVLIVTLVGYARAQGDTIGSVVEKPVRFQGVASLGLNVNWLYMIPYADLSLGVRIKERAFVGAGVCAAAGIIMINKNSEWDPAFGGWLPLVSLRGDVYLTRESRVRPFVSARLGICPIITSEDMMSYFAISAGVEYCHFMFQLGYNPLVMIDFSHGNDIFHGGYIEIGYRFHTAKYYRKKRNILQ
ncbi:MAG: hypothetical protein J5526_00620 [Bacteroidales bacterium]|nr:hypothetical protein [Bacteroidales bacterium]